jgi:hypothetical protein
LLPGTLINETMKNLNIDLPNLFISMKAAINR